MLQGLALTLGAVVLFVIVMIGVTKAVDYLWPSTPKKKRN